MRVPVSAILLVLLAAALVPFGLHSAQEPQQQKPAQERQVPTFRPTVELVNIVFSVFDRRQRFVTDLDRGNFRVAEDGLEQTVSFFSRETDLPLRIGLLLDTSNSIRGRLQFEQEAAIDFLHSVVRRGKDLAFLMTFDSEPAIIQDYTDDLASLQEAILRQRAGGGTALYDAIYYACAQRLVQPPLPAGDNPEVRRILVVISDGEDTMVSGRSLSEAIDAAQRAEAVIYTISTSTKWVSVSGSDPRKLPEKYHKTEGDKILDQLSRETGGRAFYPYRVEDLGQSFLDIGTELRSQYSLAYTPTNRVEDGRFRRVRIDVDRKGLIVRHRKGYYAPRPAAPPRRIASVPTN